jgi:tetratricopeptide (TPR) repeat protein
MLLLVLACGLSAADRFDMVVRNDYFTGFAGDKAALARAMKTTEAVLADNPKHAEAMVWHGCGTLFQSGDAAKAGDYPKSMEMYQKAMDEMAAAVALEPDNVAVLIPRGATLLTASRFFPPEIGKDLLRTGLGDYEKVYTLQKPYFDTLSGHGRAELLFGLADAYLQMGDQARAREFFTKIAAINDPENGHLRQAKAFLETGNLTGSRNCAGCHVSK